MNKNESHTDHPREDLLIDYADHQLSPDKASQVFEHLTGCAQCRVKVKALQESLALTCEIWQDKREQLDDITVPMAASTSRRFPWKWIPAAAVILLGIGLFWVLHEQAPSSEQMQPDLVLKQIERDINQATMAAKLLAATELMAKYPDDQENLQCQYRHIIEGYPHTPAAQKAKLKLN
jgi:anti-sigma factor RsiW